MFCIRMKNPYKGFLYNLVGGKIEENKGFFDCTRFAGEGNIGHMVEQAKHYGMGGIDFGR